MVTSFLSNSRFSHISEQTLASFLFLLSVFKCSSLLHSLRIWKTCRTRGGLSRLQSPCTVSGSRRRVGSAAARAVHTRRLGSLCGRPVQSGAGRSRRRVPPRGAGLSNPRRHPKADGLPVCMRVRVRARVHVVRVLTRKT